MLVHVLLMHAMGLRVYIGYRKNSLPRHVECSAQLCHEEPVDLEIFKDY